jgi:hypothetical protein
VSLVQFITPMEIVPLLIPLAIIALMIASIWKVFTKAGRPGWAALIPIYNIYLICKIAGRPGWWVLLYAVPVVSLVIAILVAIDLAKAFGKGPGFGIGLAFLAPIFYPILAFSDAPYLLGNDEPAPPPPVPVHT